MENRLSVAKGEGEGVGWTGVWISRYKLLNLEWISNEVLLGTISNFLGWSIMEDNMRKRM